MTDEANLNETASHDTASDETVSDETVSEAGEPGERMIDEAKLKQIIEGLLLAAGKPLGVDQIDAIFEEEESPGKDAIRQALAAIEADCDGRGFELQKVASGYRFQVRQDLSRWIGRLWEEKPQKYSRALLETLSIIAYRQPITRGDIEKIRGVAVSTQIIRTLLEREWIRVVGHRDVPGRPAMYATTRQFLDYFNLDSLEQLPALSEIRDMEEFNQELTLEEEKPESRVLEMPSEEEEAAPGSGAGEAAEAGQAGDGADGGESAPPPELIDEEEALALSAKPLDEILRYGEEEGGDGSQMELQQEEPARDEESGEAEEGPEPAAPDPEQDQQRDNDR